MIHTHENLFSNKMLQYLIIKKVINWNQLEKYWYITGFAYV